MSEFLWPVRIYYEDTDSGGVVYYANYLKYMERARTEFLRGLGFEQDALQRDQSILFAVRSIRVDYLLPAHFNDMLQVSAKIRNRGKARLLFEQRVTRDNGDTALLCYGEIEIVCLHTGTLRPKAIPAQILREVSDGN